MPLTRRRHPRIAGGHAFASQWSNAKAAFVGFLLGRGHSSTAIAEELADGTSDGNIREMARKWEIPTWGRKNDGFLVIPMSQRLRANIRARAQQHGVGEEEFARRILACATMPVDLYDAIVPEDQF